MYHGVENLPLFLELDVFATEKGVEDCNVV
jgi:hypothetical protein